MNIIMKSCLFLGAFLLNFPLSAATNIELLEEIKPETPSAFSKPSSDYNPDNTILNMATVLKVFQDLNVEVDHFTTNRLEVTSQLPLGVSILKNFLGLGKGTSGFDPIIVPIDANGAVGPNNYVGVASHAFAIYDKNGNLQGGHPLPLSVLWSGFGGPCEKLNDFSQTPLIFFGFHPSIKYDQIANRWVISVFAIGFNLNTNSISAPYIQCIAVSKTSNPNPSSGYFQYAFNLGNLNSKNQIGFNGKIALGRDAYFMGLDVLDPQYNLVGSQACAFNRAKMLKGPSGQAGNAVCGPFLAKATHPSILAADLDGKLLPPANSPEFFLGAFGKGTSSKIKAYKFKPNFTTPSASTWSGPINIAGVGTFIPSCNTDPMKGCIPQKGTFKKLNASSEVYGLMNRLTYRQLSSTIGTMVANHTIVSGINPAAIRWYQFNVNSSFAINLAQQGTFTPNANSRFMGSIAMDKNQNIALGYNISGPTLFPSIAITGRAKTDPKNTLRKEIIVQTGMGFLDLPTVDDGYAPFAWGNYSNIAIDPSDYCTFWYTGQYLQSTGFRNASTRVIKFKFPGCLP